MDMTFKGVDTEVAAFVHSYRIRHRCKNLTDAFERIIRDYDTIQNVLGQNREQQTKEAEP